MGQENQVFRELASESYLAGKLVQTQLNYVNCVWCLNIYASTMVGKVLTCFKHTASCANQNMTCQFGIICGVFSRTCWPHKNHLISGNVRPHAVLIFSMLSWRRSLGWRNSVEYCWCSSCSWMELDMSVRSDSHRAEGNGIDLQIWQCVKTLYPGEHQNSW